MVFATEKGGGINPESLAGQAKSQAFQGAWGQTPQQYWGADAQLDPQQGGIFAPQWDPAVAMAQQRIAAAEDYAARAEQGRTAAQQQLLGGIAGTRADMMARAGGGRGPGVAMGRAAGYAGGQLQQRGATQQAALQAQELSVAEQMKQRALAEAEQQRMGMAGQLVGKFGVEAGGVAAMSALQQSQAAAQAAREKQYLGMGMGAAGAALGQAGGYLQGQGGEGQGGEGQGGGDQPYIDQEYPSDIRLKQGVQQPRNGEEDRLFRALQAAGAQTDSALDAATGQDQRAGMLGAELQAAGRETDALLDALAGKGRSYQYNQQAQQQLGQPAGQQYGVMAQDLAKTELGRSAVVPTPQGLMVDPGRLTMIQSGLIGSQEERLRELEQQIGVK